jgi:hypothetical protein
MDRKRQPSYFRSGSSPAGRTGRPSSWLGWMRGCYCCTMKRKSNAASICCDQQSRQGLDALFSLSASQQSPTSGAWLRNWLTKTGRARSMWGPELALLGLHAGSFQFPGSFPSRILKTPIQISSARTHGAVTKAKPKTSKWSRTKRALSNPRGFIPILRRPMFLLNSQSVRWHIISLGCRWELPHTTSTRESLDGSLGRA